VLNDQFIVLGALVNFLAGVGYVIATVRGQARPNRVSWGLWSVTSWSALLGQLDEGVGMPALLTFTVALIPSLIFLASFVGGAYWRFSKLDVVCGVLAVLTLVAWKLTASGIVAIVLSILVDALAGIPTVVKAFREPESESHVAYTAGMFSAACTLLTLQEFTIATSAFAIYFFTLCTTISFLLLVTPRLRTRALRNSLRFPIDHPLPRRSAGGLREPFDPIFDRPIRPRPTDLGGPVAEPVRSYRGIPHIDLEVRVRISQFAHGMGAVVPAGAPIEVVEGVLDRYDPDDPVDLRTGPVRPGNELATQVAVPLQRTGEQVVSVAVPAPGELVSAGHNPEHPAQPQRTTPLNPPPRPTPGPRAARAIPGSQHPPTPHPAGQHRPAVRPSVGGPTAHGSGPRPGTDLPRRPPSAPLPPAVGDRRPPAPAGPDARRTDHVVPPPVRRPPAQQHPSTRPGRTTPVRSEPPRYDHGLFDPRYERGYEPVPPRRFVPPPAPPLPPPVVPARRRSAWRHLPAVLGAIAVLAALATLAYFVVDVRPITPPAPLSPPAPAAVLSAPAAAPQAVATSIAVPTVHATLPVGPTPGHMQLAPNGKFGLIAHRDAGIISVFDTTTDAVTATIPVAAGPPWFMSFAPDSSRAYLSIYDPIRAVNLVGVLDLASKSVVATIPVGRRPMASAVSPDGSRLWVPSHDDGVLDIIDTTTNTVVGTVPVPPNPHWVAFSDDGSRAYVADHESNVVTVLDTATDATVATIPVGASPHSVAVSPPSAVGHDQIAVVSFDASTVSMIDATTNAVVSEVPVGKDPQDVAYAPDGRYLYTADVDDDAVSVVDTATHAVTATIPVCDAPTSISTDPTGQQAYVTCLNSGEVVVLDTTAGR
jgi:YVTN family beta-propeller protein